MLVGPIHGVLSWVFLLHAYCNEHTGGIPFDDDLGTLFYLSLFLC
jgi:hypothetical protein